jgi:hypothetical protein
MEAVTFDKDFFSWLGHATTRETTRYCILFVLMSYCLTEYVVTLSERLDKINKVAFNQMTLVRERQKRQYDIKTNKILYLVVSLVVA